MKKSLIFVFLFILLVSLIGCSLDSKEVDNVQVETKSLEPSSELVTEGVVSKLDKTESVNINEDVLEEVGYLKSLNWQYSYEYENIQRKSENTLSILSGKKLELEDLLSMGFKDPELEPNLEIYLITVKFTVLNSEYIGKNGAFDESYFTTMFDPELRGVETEKGGLYIGAVQSFGFDGCFDDAYKEEMKKYSNDGYSLSIKTGDTLPPVISTTGDLVVIVEKGIKNYLSIRDNDVSKNLLLEIPKFD